MEQAAFEAHGVWEAATAVERALLDTEDAAASDDTVAREQIRTVLAYLRSFDEVPAFYFSAAMLDAATPALSSAASGLGPHGARGAAAQMESLLPIMGGWPQPTAKGGAGAKAAKAFTEYRDSAIAALASLREALEQAQAKAEADRGAAEQATRTMQDRLTALETEAEAAAARVTSEVTRLDAALTGNNEAFTEAQSKRSERFQEWLADQAKTLEEGRAEFDESFEQLERDGREHLAAITKIRDDTDKMAARATSAVLARNHGKYALREWVTGLFAYFVGFLVLGCIAGFLIQTLSKVGPTDKLSWQFVTLKLGLTLTGAAAATVAFRFAGKSMHRADTNKRVELELLSIGPLLRDLELDDPEVVTKTKTTFVDRTFGHAFETPASEEEVISVATLGKVGEIMGKWFGSK